MSNTTDTITIPADIARFLADRARHDLEYAAEQHADCVTKAHELRKTGDKEQIPQAAAVYYAQAERMDRKADNWNDEFKQLEDICKALTRAGA